MGTQVHNAPHRSSVSSDSARLPVYHARTGPFVITYEGCVRLCLKNSKRCPEARAFLEHECSLLRTAFNLDQFVLQPEDELLNEKISQEVVHGVNKCRNVAEIKAYDLVLEAAMKAQNFNQKNLLLHGQWRWLVTKFASYYGVSDAYTKLKYLSYVMEVATPTAHCLNVVFDLFSPVSMKRNETLSSLENHMLVDLSKRIKELIASVFENYKSLDESSPSGFRDTTTKSGRISPAIKPALELYWLLHDIKSPEAKMQLCEYFQAAVRKILEGQLTETNSSGEKSTVDETSYKSGYRKMKLMCVNIRNEIVTDRKIHNSHVLPTFVDLPNLSTALYSSVLCKRMHAFLGACPPTTLSPPVTDLIITTCDLQKDLAYWNIGPVQGGVDAKALFDMYITKRIHDKNLELHKSCKLYKGGGQQHSAPVFVDDMYKQLKDTLGEFQVIVSRLPEYILPLEKVIADTERAMMNSLDKQYSEFLSALKENTMPVKALQYVQKISKGLLPYSLPEELGTLFNVMWKMLHVLQPKLESQFKPLSLCISKSENAVPGELLSEVTLMLRTKFKNNLQGAVEKLAGNTRLQNVTNLKKVIQKAKEGVSESDIRNRMQPLKDLLKKIIGDLHGSLEIQVFKKFCRALWDHMGQDMLKVLANTKEKPSYESCRLVLSLWHISFILRITFGIFIFVYKYLVEVLNETFRSEMQALVGRKLKDKERKAPKSILEVRSMLRK